MRAGKLVLAFAAGLCFLVLAAGCATTREAPIYVVRVERGDTLAGIAMKYDTDWRQIAALNKLSGGVALRPGQMLRVRPGPGGYAAGLPQVAGARGSAKAPANRRPGSKGGLVTAPEDAAYDESDNAMFEEAAQQDEGSGTGQKQRDKSPRRGLLFNSSQNRFELIWPVNGQLSSLFGRRGRSYHKGIDIRAPHGTPIGSAGAGRVAFAGRRSGFGRLVIVQHQNVKTYYAHLSSIDVEKGAWVDAGELIGEVGATGNATGPHLHFEIRDSKDRSLDPLTVLEKERLISSL